MKYDASLQTSASDDSGSSREAISSIIMALTSGGRVCGAMIPTEWRAREEYVKP